MANESNHSLPNKPKRAFNRHKVIMATGATVLALVGAKSIINEDYSVGVATEIAAAAAATTLRRNGDSNSPDLSSEHEPEQSAISKDQTPEVSEEQAS